ncbi:DUF1592 domain-containing protein [Bremerella cremea]|uniref:DUF1592 domain-containing protein n=1 Tax=Bremerella cremea TaxID=1031537 RepID=A0A368KMF3_9BACT|nr:DUF1592 domain-containing protein [Bremerella cremea]RCS43524.1 DUF1592 domain-containing protein [Bremerella cremea]
MLFAPRITIGLFLLAVFLRPQLLWAEPNASFDRLATQYQQRVAPLLKTYCNDCHSTADKQGELDLEKYADLAAIRHDPAAWQKVEQMVRLGEMPPEDSEPLSPTEKKELLAWVQDYLVTEAKANAGDPGPVMLRRLNNDEYTYTIRDLTGAPLEPAKEFPVDGAAGEGFTNTGNALVMSPSLVRKYLDAGKAIADHAVLLPDGFRFSAGETRRDFTDEILAEIREIYFHHIRDVGNAHALDRWNVKDPKTIMAAEGRIDLEPYFAALIRHRSQLTEDIDQATLLAQQENLNAKYFTLLAHMLLAAEPNSPLLADLRQRFQAADESQAAALAQTVRAWQDAVWKFNSVGHFGSIRPWQEATNPIVRQQEFRGKLNSAEAVTLSLNAIPVTDTAATADVIWRRPRLERPGLPPILLRDLETTIAAVKEARQEVISRTPDYLAAAYQIQQSAAPTDLTAVAAQHSLNPQLLTRWLDLLEISYRGEAAITSHLPQRLSNIAGQPNINGWGSPGLDALSVAANPTDSTVHIPGELRPHAVTMHPRPERWIAAGWRSPITGNVSVEAHVRDAHSACGNGVSWWLEHHRGSKITVLASGDVDSGGEATTAPIASLEQNLGDAIVLKIGPRAGSHVCDLTEVDLTITEVAENGKTWQLSADCADRLGEANPLADRFGNEATWHFFYGRMDEQAEPSQLPPDSLLAKWKTASSAEQAQAIAHEIEQRFAKAAGEGQLEESDYLYADLLASAGQLLGSIVVQAKSGGSEDLVASLPAAVSVSLPGAMWPGAEFVTSVEVPPGGPAIQAEVGNQPLAEQHLIPGKPIVIPPGPSAEASIVAALNDFRHYFPAIVCYPQIVPVDEGVTLVLFHREDEQLSRLMLSDEEHARLDRLWGELRYVSRDALDITVALEQLLEFATQDGDPTIFEPLREPIKNRAIAFRQQLIDTQPAHVDALVRFTEKAYRRPLTPRDEQTIRELYAELRAQKQPHEEAIKLSLARILASPGFLYRAEIPGPGKEARPVDNYELATRLSYFLWSTTPDETLRELAAAGKLQDDAILEEQTKRMLQDERIRRLAIQFACQWLHVRDFDQFDEKSEQHYPQFAELRGPMYEESVLFFEDMFRNNGSILDILTADHTFLNEELAQHYGIPEVQGEQWRKVEGVRQFGRGGILTQATVLAKNSGASRTSPILRGNWISETLLGERLPRPPLNVPVLPETAPAGLTERQLIEKHSSVAECAKCHKRIDPYGFALESYDTIGALRSEDQSGLKIDATTTLMDGTPIDGMEGIRDYIANQRRETFVKQFCKKLLGYALGRSVRLSDQPLLDEIYDDLQQNDFRVQIAIERIVLSPQFREIRGNEFSGIE